MKNLILYIFFLSICNISHADYERYFTKESFRVDFILAGNNKTTKVYLHAQKKEPYWGGTLNNLIDTLKYGSFFYTISLPETKEIIFSMGFCTLYEEWQTTKEAREMQKAFYETVTFPFPKEKVNFELFKRDEKGLFKSIYTVLINPDDYFIEGFSNDKYEIVPILKTNDPAHSVDIAFLPEGYTKEEMPKFINDVKKICDSIFTVYPFNKYKNNFSVNAILSPSQESGTDIPGTGIWKNTIINSNFYTFDSERYLTTSDYWKVRDIASLVPYDNICILVNTSKYGGGGIYNHYNLTAVDHEVSADIFIHEFGHGFGGLADEYYTSNVSYENFYPLEVEPWEPNITTLVNFDKKWKSILSKNIPIPTPDTIPWINSPGVFEGGGYVAKGVFRPEYNCRMKSLKQSSFCKVCELSIEKMIHRMID